MKVHKMSFIKLVLLTATIFLIIVFLIEFLYALTSKESTSQIIANMTQIKFLIIKSVGALFYGIMMALFFKWMAKKEKNK